MLRFIICHLLKKDRRMPDDASSVFHPEMKAQFEAEVFDLIVVGAGVAGLNALHAATQYLPKTARVLLLDQKPKAGGMWNVAYDYVRLHQPHPMFTVGDLAWDWDKPRHYLARRDEIQSHLENTLEPIAKAVNLESRFGVTVSACDEIFHNATYLVQVCFHPNDKPEEVVRLYAERVINASGLNYREAQPLRFESDAVVSIVPSALSQILAERPDAPVVVVGGGKTGMDTVIAALDNGPNRHVTLIKGRGTSFLNRTKYLPTGFARWTSGVLASRFFRDMALTYDGTNETELLYHVRKTYATDPKGDNAVFLFGLLSEEELQHIQTGLSSTLNGYLEDVIDTSTGPHMRLRDGSLHITAPGAIIVNCSGSFFRSVELETDVPVLSPRGTIMSINARSAFHFLTTASAFFCTHLLYRGKLQGQGIYTLDHEKLFRTNRDAWVGAAAVQSYLNFCMAVKLLPMNVLLACGINLDLWYPLPRRALALLQMHMTARRDIAHCTSVLDHIAKRFDVRCEAIE